MKKRMILLTVILLIISVVFSVYFSNRKKEPISIEEQLLTSKDHKHIGPDGTVVKHRHVYEIADLPDNVVKPGQVSEAKHPIQSAWEALDLDAIKRKYQPYTVAEMQEMWLRTYTTRFGPNYPHHLDEAYPQEEWLQRNLELGQHFADAADYNTTLQRRIYMIKHRVDWDSGNEEDRAKMRRYLDLPPDVDTWEEYEDAFLKTLITSYHTFVVATEADPDIEGGTVGTDGTLVPFKKNTVYVHVNPDNGLSTFTGTELTDEEEDALITYGVSPDGITVIYTDESGKPLSSDTPSPRFYERDMKELAKAYSLLQQQIEEHEFLLELDALLPSSESQKQSSATPHDHVHEQGHSHTHDLPKDAEDVPLPQRPPPDAKRLPPGLEIPSELRTPDAVQRWWTQLEALHGGELPKDLQALREVMMELEKIKKEGEAKLKPPPRPERPRPSKRNSPPPPDEDD